MTHKVCIVYLLSEVVVVLIVLDGLATPLFLRNYTDIGKWIRHTQTELYQNPATFCNS